MKKVWIYEKGEALRVFGGKAEAHLWLRVNGLGGTAIECEVGERRPPGTADRYAVPRATERPTPTLRLVK
jgi:hypothetical protein